jgi:hypothetical protein
MTEEEKREIIARTLEEIIKVIYKSEERGDYISQEEVFQPSIMATLYGIATELEARVEELQKGN